MTPMIERQVLNLIAAIQNDICSVCGADEADEDTCFEAHNLGEYIYGINITNQLSVGARAVIHVQWPRLHRWIVDAKQRGEELVWSHMALGPETVHVSVGIAGSAINYVVILDRPVLLDMLHDQEVSPETSAEDMWNMVLKYECL